MYSTKFNIYLLLINFLLSSVICNGSDSSKEEILMHLGNGIAAIAEGEIITVEELRKTLDPMIPKIRLQAKNEIDFNNQINAFSKDILDNMIDRIIIVKEADKLGMQIPPSYIDEEYDSIIRDEFNNNRTKFLSYLNVLGKNPVEFRNDLKENLIVSIMKSRLNDEIPQVSPEKIESYYFENKIRFYQPSLIHLKQIILIPDKNDEFEKIVNLSNEIMNKLDAGISIEELSNKYANTQYNRPNGDWGWLKREDLRAEISEIAFDLDIGEYSKPIIIDNAVFIIYAENIKDEMIQPISEVRDIIEEILKQELSKKAMNEWLNQLRENAYIRYFI